MAAALAKDRAKQAVWTLGIIGTIAWVAGTIAMSRISPAWYGIVGAVLAIPTSLLGGKLYELRTRQLTMKKIST